GSIVLIGSVLSRHPSRLFATHAYAAAKGATASMSKAMASYYAADGIRVNLISPGLVQTPMSERAAEDPASISFAAVKQPLAGGLLDPDDIAYAALFLLSDEANRITGQVLEVDGGWGVTEASP
ncbi:MAG: SDR family oxidoreductase, partial [Actinomycetota bacterium]|nr:SDR family oxidoreductase [Actinomycetota bacterium]